MSLVIQITFDDNGIHVAPSMPMNSMTMIGALEIAKMALLEPQSDEPKIVIPKSDIKFK